MELVDTVIQEFGQQMGVPDLDASKSTVMSFVFEKRGVLFIEKSHEEVLIYLARKIEFVDHELCEKILKLCHYDNDFSLFMSASFKDQDKLIVMTRVASKDFNLQIIDRAIDQLTAFFDQLNP